MGQAKNELFSVLERFLLLGDPSLISAMKKMPSVLVPGRHAVLTATFCVVVFGAWLTTPSVHSQAPAATTPNTALTPLLTKLKTQQDQLAANQTKIEAQTALLKEEIRQTKIFAGRAGSRR